MSLRGQQAELRALKMTTVLTQNERLEYAKKQEWLDR